MSEFPKTTASKKAKLSDVARLANVSASTVSRVLNQPQIVRPEIRERVQNAIVMLDYSPDRMAKALSSGKSHTIGTVVPTIGGSAIFSDGVEALQDELETRGYSLLVSSSQYDLEREFQQIKTLLDYGAAGLVLVGDTFSSDALRLIKKFGIPTVTTYTNKSRHGIPAIGIDNRLAAQNLTRLLLSLGHKKFGIIANIALQNDRSQARVDGVRDALAEAGVPLPISNVVEVKLPTIENGRRGLAGLLELVAVPTAIVCTTDALALGVMSEARRRGLHIPDDMSVVGFDDIDVAAETDPALTTVKNPAAEIGRIAAEYLSRAMDGHTIPLETELPARLSVRSSTGVAPADRSSAEVSPLE
ncbi:LacI family DNA-binding transcriptional regulator [Pararhizobium sp. DWP3-4]|uniref:LacI family DNA-binding transcriptional regulator n=1 Tax=Pararhizobium sp. DWP3-4 TaxID=2804565 RepID=UPI003CEDDAD7